MWPWLHCRLPGDRVRALALVTQRLEASALVPAAAQVDVARNMAPARRALPGTGPRFSHHFLFRHVSPSDPRTFAPSHLPPRRTFAPSHLRPVAPLRVLSALCRGAVSGDTRI